MSEPEPRPRNLSPEAAARVVRLLADDCARADCEDAPLYALQMAEEDLAERSLLDRADDDHLDWDADGQIVLVRGDGNKK